MPARIRRFCEETGSRRRQKNPGRSRGASARAWRSSTGGCSSRRGDDRPDGRTSSTSWAAASRTSCCASSRRTLAAPVAGPVEATALGNVLVQAYSRGHVGSLEEMRAVVRSPGGRARLPAGGQQGRKVETTGGCGKVMRSQRATGQGGGDWRRAGREERSRGYLKNVGEGAAV